MEQTGSGLAIIPQRELTPKIWGMISQMAPVMYKSRLFGVASEEQATAIMLKGYEMGLSITASFELIQVVQGKPSLSPRGALALLHNDPRIKKITVTRLIDASGKYLGHECYMARSNGFEYTVRFTLDDAKRAGVIKPGSAWETYPENLCQWRAIGFAADMVAPDLISGMSGMMKMPEQYGVTLTGDGDVVDYFAPTASTPAPVVPAPVTITLGDLVDKYGAQQVMDANGGTIPGTDAELATVAAKLGGG
jgi:hypothetical protein